MDIFTNLFPFLANLLGRLGTASLSKDLLDLLSRIFGPGAGAPKDKALTYLQGRLDAQTGRTAGRELAHATLKEIENAQNPSNMPGTPEQRIAIGQALASAAALAFTHAGEKLLALQDAQAAVERARGTGDLEAARAVRQHAEAIYTAACVDIGRAASGYVLPTTTPPA